MIINAKKIELTGNTYTYENAKDVLNITAYFKEKEYNVTINSSGHGVVDIIPDRTKFLYGQSLTVRIDPEEMYRIKTFKVNGEDKLGNVIDNQYIVNSVSEDLNIDVEFEFDNINYKNITVKLDDKVLYSRYLPLNTSFTYEIKNSLFSEGTELDEDASILPEGFYIYNKLLRSDQIKNDAEIKLVSKKKKYNIRLIWHAGGYMTVDNETPEHGEDVLITIIPDTHHELDKLTVNEKAVKVEGNTYTIKVEEDLNIEASFIRPTYKVTFKTNLELEQGPSDVLKGENIEFDFSSVLNIDTTYLENDCHALLDGNKLKLNNVSKNIVCNVKFKVNTEKVKSVDKYKIEFEKAIRESYRIEVTKLPLSEELKAKGILELYDIKVLDSEDNVITIENNKMKIYLPLSEELKNKVKHQVYFIKDKKLKETLKTKVAKDKIIFEVDHLSEFGIKAEDKKEVNKTPKTGVSNTLRNILISVFISIMIISIATYLILNKKYN